MWNDLGHLRAVWLMKNNFLSLWFFNLTLFCYFTSYIFMDIANLLFFSLEILDIFLDSWFRVFFNYFSLFMILIISQLMPIKSPLFLYFNVNYFAHKIIYQNIHKLSIPSPSANEQATYRLLHASISKVCSFFDWMNLQWSHCI